MKPRRGARLSNPCDRSLRHCLRNFGNPRRVADSLLIPVQVSGRLSRQALIVSNLLDAYRRGATSMARELETERDEVLGVCYRARAAASEK